MVERVDASNLDKKGLATEIIARAQSLGHVLRTLEMAMSLIKEENPELDMFDEDFKDQKALLDHMEAIKRIIQRVDNLQIYGPTGPDEADEDELKRVFQDLSLFTVHAQ